MFIVISTAAAATAVAAAASFSRVTNHSSDHRSSSSSSSSCMIVSCLSYASFILRFILLLFLRFFINIYTRLGAVPLSCVCVCVYICWYWRTSFSLLLFPLLRTDEFSLSSSSFPPLSTHPTAHTNTHITVKENKLLELNKKKKWGKEQRPDRLFNGNHQHSTTTKKIGNVCNFFRAFPQHSRDTKKV